MLIERIRKSVLHQNIISLYGVQSVNYLLPLVVVPFLMRVLRPDGWGRVAFVQSLAMMVILVVEYGFTLSASRGVSIRRHDSEWLGKTLGAVTIAKISLLAAASTVVICASPWIPNLRGEWRLFYAGLFWAAAQGLSPLWFFQGMERIRFSSTTDIVCKIAGVVAILLLVRSESQGWLVLLIYAAASTASTSYMYYTALSEFGLWFPAAKDVIAVLQDGVTLFMFQASVALYTSANVFILGLFVAPYAVGIYAGAERITKSVLQLLGPINQALYPRMNAIVHSDLKTGGAIIRRAFWLVLTLTTALAILLVVTAPLLVRILLGSRFHQAVSIVRIMALLVPIIGASNMLGVQWMLPLRRDRAFNLVVLISGLLNVSLAPLLARKYTGNGMAVAVVCSELFVTLGCFGYLWLHRMNPILSAIESNATAPCITEVLQRD